jgi:hypothetical protein
MGLFRFLARTTIGLLHSPNILSALERSQRPPDVSRVPQGARPLLEKKARVAGLSSWS